MEASMRAQNVISMEFIENIPLYKTEKPYFASLPSSQIEEGYKTNLVFVKVKDIPIFDIRGGISESIHEIGFTHINHEFKGEVSGDEEKCSAFISEVQDLVQNTFDAESTICYDYRLRKNVPSNYAAKSNLDDDRSLQAPPVTTVHMDHTQSGGFHRIRRHLTREESEKYLSGAYRVRIVNAWRPLHMIEDSPLALCDPRSLVRDDLLETDRVSPFYAGEIYYVKHNPDHKWYWLRKQTPNEVTLFVTFDSVLNGNGLMNACPHASFDDPNAPADALPRESVEVRVIVFNPISR